MALASLIAALGLVIWLAPWNDGTGAIVEPTSPDVLPTMPAISLAPAEAGDVFVSPTGDDTAAGGRDTPLATVEAALAKVAAGHTVWLASGTYPAFVITRSGDAEHPITVAGMSADAPSIQAGTSGPTIDLGNVHDIALENLDVAGPSGSQAAAVYLQNSERVSIRGSRIAHARAGFGIEVRFSAEVQISDNDLFDNAVGVSQFGEGDPDSVHDVTISGNRIHDNHSMIVDDPAPDNDFGANAIIWHKVTGRTTAVDNQLWSNHASSHDYGTDGGAFEIWASSNMTISGNVAWDNENVLETGSDGEPCSNLVFTRNVAYTTDRGVGLILRCAENGLVAHNVIDGVDGYAFALSDRGGGNHFATSIDGLRIVDNIVTDCLVYDVGNAISGTIDTDYNLYWEPLHTPLAKFPGLRFARTLADLAEITGRDAHSLQARPLFVDAPGHDYRLLAGSPGIDAGTTVAPGEAFTGTAPDIGAYEGGVALPSPS